MSAIQVIVRPKKSRSQDSLAAVFAFFDVVVDGVNLTARIGVRQSLTLLVDLGHCVAKLNAGTRSRAVLQLGASGPPWELGIEADGPEALLSVYQAGPAPNVAVFERRAALVDLTAAVADALEGAEGSVDEGHRPTLARARRALAESAERAISVPRRLVRAQVAPAPQAGFRLSTNAVFRSGGRTSASNIELEQADLHGLLMRGTLTLEAAGPRSVAFPEVHLCLAAEGLAILADEVLETWQAGRALFRRFEVARMRVSVRAQPGGTHVLLNVPCLQGETKIALPQIPSVAFVRAVVAFGLELAETVCRSDPAQRRNLRLSALVATLKGLEERVDEAESQDTCTNPEPESYRLFGVPRARAEHQGSWSHGATMRFLPRWVATVPGIDVRATFLCGDRLIVGSARETACIHRQNGDVLWRTATTRAATAATPHGLARIHQDGRIQFHDLESGAVRYSIRLSPRLGGGASGALVYAPGLPKLLIVAEGDRRITAVELLTGEVRWRHTARCRASYRIRRAGKLLLVAGGDSALVALDVQSGEVVWRVRDRHGFSGEIAIDHDAAFAVSGALGGTPRLYHLNLWSGEAQWVKELDNRPIAGQAPVLTPSHVALPARDRRGVGIYSFARRTGDLAWEHAPGFMAPGTSWLAVDEMIVGNSAAGAFVGIEAGTGALRFQHIFSRPSAGDQPRCLEPILRSGALFVPQHQVQVIRPADGEIIGAVPSDLIPDLLRVDERCDVYIAEESGHLAAFGAAPRLTLVKC